MIDSGLILERPNIGDSGKKKLLLTGRTLRTRLRVGEGEPRPVGVERRERKDRGEREERRERKDRGERKERRETKDRREKHNENQQ